MTIKMNGNEARALKGLNEKMQYIAPLLTMMVVHKISQERLAMMADVPYSSVRKMIRSPSHGSVETFKHLLETLTDYDEKLKKEFPDYEHY